MSPPCRRNTSRLIALLSGSLRPRVAERLREHLERCPGCARAFERLQSTAELCRSLGAEPAPTLPWRQIEAQVTWQIGQDAAAARSIRWLPMLAGMSVALLVGGLLGLAIGRHGSSPAPPRTQPLQVSAASIETPLHDEELAAVVTVAQGEISVVSSKGKARPLLPSRPLLQGERVLTAAGRVGLQWEAGTGMLLGSETEAELHHLRLLEQEIRLWRGRLEAQVSHRHEGQSFKIVADRVRSVVMGTSFAVELDDEAVTIEVDEGKVQVEETANRFPPIEVPAGMLVRVPRDPDLRPTLARATRRPQRSLLNLVSWPSFQRVMASTGLLVLESLPSGADVVFDSRPVGTTNLTLRGDLGRHLLELWRGGKLVSRRWIDIDLGAGRLALDITPRPERPAPMRLPAEIHAVFKQRAVQIQACYERRLKNNPSLEGQLTLRVEVNRAGQVTGASLELDTLADPRVGQCALSIVRRWEFPVTAEDSEFVYPFHFRPR